MCSLICSASPRDHIGAAPDGDFGVGDASVLATNDLAVESLQVAL
jgi:hypothetical protein